jgi:hypothetical protein
MGSHYNSRVRLRGFFNIIKHFPNARCSKVKGAYGFNAARSRLANRKEPDMTFINPNSAVRQYTSSSAYDILAHNETWKPLKIWNFTVL